MNNVPQFVVGWILHKGQLSSKSSRRNICDKKLTSAQCYKTLLWKKSVSWNFREISRIRKIVLNRLNITKKLFESSELMKKLFLTFDSVVKHF